MNAKKELQERTSTILQEKRNIFKIFVSIFQKSILRELYCSQQKWTYFEEKIKMETSFNKKIVILNKAIQYLKYKVRIYPELANPACNTDILYIYRYSRVDLEKIEEIQRGIKFVASEITKYTSK